MARPHFLILGCQKGGTTTLYDLLCRHPRVEAALEKEVQFFSFRYGEGWAWYRQQLPHRRSLIGRLRDRPRCGEASPYYLFYPLAAERIARHAPKARLIVLLRDPVDRALSQYFHSVRLGLEHLPLMAALAAEPERLQGADEALARGERHRSHQEHSYLQRSRYGHQLQRYVQHFPKQQLLVLSSEAFFADPTGTTQQVWRFLGLEPAPLSAQPILNQGLGEAAAVSAEERQQLEGLLNGERNVVKHWLASHGPEAHGL